MGAKGNTHGERVVVTVALVAALAGSGVAVADDSGTSTRPEPGRIAYTDGSLSLAAGTDPDGAAAPVIEVPDVRPAAAPTPGWDTTEVPDGTVDQDTVRWSLTGLDGPGELKVYAKADGSGSDPLLFDSADGLPDGYGLPTGQEGFTRWEFTAEGTYRAIFTAEATTLEGRELSTSAVYTVLVGSEAAKEPGTTPSDASEAPPAAPEAPAAGPVLQPPLGSSDLVASRASEETASTSSPVPTAKAAPHSDKVLSTPTVIDEGHIDIAARVVGRRMQIHVKDGTVSGKTTWREPSSVTLHVKPAAKNSLPAGDAFAFLGKPGSPVWLLDQVQQDGLLWPGWSTDNIGAGVTKGGVGFSLTAAKGPGEVALYTYDAMSGANILFNTRDGVPDSFEIPANAHAHGGWAFTKEGTYRLTFKMSGKLADGTAVSDTETVAFVVGDEDPNAATPGNGSGSGSGNDSTSGAKGGEGGEGANAGSSGNAAAGVGVSPGSGSSSGGGSMASTGAGSAVLLGGTATVLAALGAAFIAVTRTRRRRNPAGVRA